jgi:leucyl-tRNA synthetase
MTLRECITYFGVDASRIALSDAGDTMDDANFDSTVANAAIMKLFVLEDWL